MTAPTTQANNNVPGPMSWAMKPAERKTPAPIMFDTTMPTPVHSPRIRRPSPISSGSYMRLVLRGLRLYTCGMMIQRPSLALLVTCGLSLACSRQAPAAGSQPAAPPSPRALAEATPPATTPPTTEPAPAPQAGEDFSADARLLYRVAACGPDDGTPLPQNLDAGVIKEHCD